MSDLSKLAPEQMFGDARALSAFPDKVVALMRASLSLMPLGLRSRLFWIVPLMVLAACLETIGLALIIPLVGAIAQPDRLDLVPGIGFLRALTGNPPPGTLLTWLAGAAALFYLLKNVTLALTTYAENSFIMTAVATASADLLRKYMAAPYIFHLRHNSAELIRNVNLSMDTVFRGILKPTLRLFSELFVIAGFFVVLILADALTTLVTSAFLGLFMAFFFWLTNRAVTSWGRRTQSIQAISLQWLNQALGSLKETRVLQRTDFFLRAYHKLRQETGIIHAKHQSVIELPRLIIETLLVITFVLATALILARSDDSQRILPLLAVYAFAGFRLMPSFTRVIQTINTLRFNGPAALDIAHHNSELQQAGDAASASASGGNVHFQQAMALDGISYSFPGSATHALHKIDLVIGRGQSVALVGPSGAGKTTLANIILGLLEPDSGRLLIDGKDIGDRIASWQRLIGYVPQSIYLLDDSVRRNVAIGIEDAAIDDRQVTEALRLAQLEDTLHTMPHGLDTRLGENGVRLSGGQRQRIGIARALYHRPEVLVMDEATSSLDGVTEREITAAIEILGSRLTIIVIAHRLSTVRRCDVVAYLDRGRIVDRGTFNELCSRNADFRRLAELGDVVETAV